MASEKEHTPPYLRTTTRATIRNKMNTDGTIIVKNRKICQELVQAQVQECLLRGEVDGEMLYQQMQARGVSVKVRTSDGTSHEIAKERVLAWIKHRISVQVQEKIELNKANAALIHDVLSATGTSNGLAADRSIDEALHIVSNSQGIMSSKTHNVVPSKDTVASPAASVAPSKDTATLAATSAATSDLQTSSFQRCFELLEARLQTYDDTVPSNIWICNDTAFLRLSAFAVSHCVRIGRLDKDYAMVIFQEMKEQNVSFHIRTQDPPFVTTDLLTDDCAFAYFCAAVKRIVEKEKAVSEGSETEEEVKRNPTRPVLLPAPTDESLVVHNKDANNVTGRAPAAKNSAEETIVDVVLRDLSGAPDNLPLILRKNRDGIHENDSVSSGKRKSRYLGVSTTTEGRWRARLWLDGRELPCKCQVQLSPLILEHF